MKKVAALLSAAVLMISASLAMAAEETGKVMTVDPPTRTLTLDDGTQFSVAENVQIDLLQPGQEVTVSYEEQDGQRIANDIMIQE